MQTNCEYLSRWVIFFVTTMLVACVPYSKPVYKTKSDHVSEVDFTQHTSNHVLQQQFLDKLNTIRAQGRECGDQYYPAVDALALNERLIQTAYRHSFDMSKHDYLDHISSNGDTLVERLQRSKYSWRVIAENIAHNQRSIEEVLEDWLSSPGHCSNMMSAEYRHTGMAQVNWYWTQVYASPK